VLAIEPCPPLASGPGRTVTGTFAHSAADVLDLEIEGLDTPLGCTANHPFWSEDRQDFVPAGSLTIGEHLRTESGTLRQVTRITPRRGPPVAVFNLEVDAEHVYYVSTAGVLVHNTYPGNAPSNNVLVFRVEGTPNSHVVIGEGGMVAIKEGNQTVFFNFGSKARAEQYLAQKLEKGLPGATVKSFEVPRSFLDDLRANAVSERRARLLPDRPFIVDVTKAADQFGLRPEQIEALRRAIIQGTGQEGF
jgi:hypothetical protein